MAISGRNGAGKSTLIDLLMGFYIPEKGVVCSGKIPISTWAPDAWRASIGLMLQDTVLLHGTLADNLAIANSEATRDAMVGALEMAGAADLLQTLPAGLDTVVGARGHNLSEGEIQLIGVARLILRDPKILLLDEPAAHLDGPALEKVRTALARLAEGRTLILTGHAPERLGLTDRTLRLENGTIQASEPSLNLRDSRSQAFEEG